MKRIACAVFFTRKPPPLEEALESADADPDAVFYKLPLQLGKRDIRCLVHSRPYH